MVPVISAGNTGLEKNHMVVDCINTKYSVFIISSLKIKGWTKTIPQKCLVRQLAQIGVQFLYDKSERVWWHAMAEIIGQCVSKEVIFWQANKAVTSCNYKDLGI